MKKDKTKLQKYFSSLGTREETDIFDRLVGSQIINAGFHPNYDEGGLTIDYIKNGKQHRVIFGYNELGTWIAYDK
mgnify:CR=1 FL=1